MASISERALQPKEIPASDMPIAERYRLLSEEYSDEEDAATIMEEMKTTTLEQMKSAIIAARGEMADTKAERLAKSHPDWEKYIRAMVGHRNRANRMKLKLKYLEMLERREGRVFRMEETERRLLRSTP